MVHRCLFLAALIVVCGCGPNEAPKKATEPTAAAAQAAPGKQQPGSAAPQAKIPRVSVLISAAGAVSWPRDHPPCFFVMA